MKYSLLPILLIAFSTLNYSWFVFCNSFSGKVPTISSPLKLNSQITYVHDTIFLDFLITKTSSDQFGTRPSAKMFFYFDILIWSPISNLASSVLRFYQSQCICSKGFIFIVLWYILFYSLTVSANLSIDAFLRFS